MPVQIQGIGVVGGFGCGVEAFRQALLSGNTAAGHYPIVHAGEPLDLPAFQADTERLQDFVPLRALRRVDRFSRLGMLGAYLALQDAGVPAETRHERLGVIIATGLGPTGITFAFEDTFIHAGDMCASPTYFANSVHNSVAANISLMLGATGPNSTVTQFHLSVPAALQTAWLWLEEKRVDRVLFGAVDELSELIAYAFYRKFGKPPDAKMRPLAFEKNSAVIGEGAAFFLLSNAAGNRPGYAALGRPDQGRFGKLKFSTEKDFLLVLGADGRKDLGAGYAEVLAAGSQAACFTSHYGSSPVSPAFDLAAAALMLKNQTVFPTPDAGSCGCAASVAAAGKHEKLERIACLTQGEDQGYGILQLNYPALAE